MKTTYKILNLLLSAAILFTLFTGCGKSDAADITEIAVTAALTLEATQPPAETTTEPTEETTEAVTEPTEEATAPTEPEGVPGVVANTSWLNVRKAPGAGSERVTQLGRGTKVTVYETVTVDGTLWGRIDEGWVSMEYIKLDGDIPAPTENREEKPSEPTEETTIPTEPEHVHAYTEMITKPTCTQDGFTTYTCKCGDTYKDNYVNSLGHKWSQWKTVKEPTETAEGQAERICSNCGDKETKTLPMLIPDHTHKYTEKVTKAPTCTSEGTKTFTCSCGGKYTEVIPKLGHKFSTKTVKATCTARGYTEHTCENCGYSYKDNYSAGTAPHSYQCSETFATCDKDGKKVYTCSVCKDSYTETTPRTGHNYETTTKNPTCTEDGSKTTRCKICGESATETIPATGHKWGNWVTDKEPTESATGSKSRTCSVCGKKETQTIDKLPSKPTECNHTYSVTSQTAATCTAAGSKVSKCTKCGDTKTETIPATGHKWLSWVIVKEPTTSVTGKAERTCSKCSYKESKTLDKLPPDSSNPGPEKPAPCNHSYTLTSQVAATCTESGRNNYVCSKCGKTKTEPVNPIGHKWAHHHEDEVGHWVTTVHCHCGWSTPADGYASAWKAHISSVEDPYNHSYYDDSKWVVDVPAKDWDTCTICGATK